MRRKRWEARILAIEIAKAIDELLGSARGRGPRGYTRVSADALLARMGTRIT